MCIAREDERNDACGFADVRIHLQNNWLLSVLTCALLNAASCMKDKNVYFTFSFCAPEAQSRPRMEAGCTERFQRVAEACIGGRIFGV